MFITRVRARRIEGAGVQHLLSPLSSPCFWVKSVYNYGHWGWEREHITVVQLFHKQLRSVLSKSEGKYSANETTLTEEAS